MMTAFAERALWQQTSVQQFLTDVNWEGLELPIRSAQRSNEQPPADSSRVDPNAPLPMTLSVSQFLTSVNWDGATLVAVPMDLLPAEMSAGGDQAEVFTLNDFSDLF
jgi:hypothetical protein